MNENYREINVAHLAKKTYSILNNYTALIALRNKEKTLQYGKYEKLELKDNQIFADRTF